MNDAFGPSSRHSCPGQIKLESVLKNFAEVAQKFRMCAAYGGLDSGRIEAVIECVSAFESLGSFSELLPLIESV